MKKSWSLLLTLVFTVGLISLVEVTEVNAAEGVVMMVNGTEYTEHGKGWSEAVKLANDGTKTNITLYADWNAENGSFSYSNGTDKGYLYLGDSDIDLTIDLNGHTINRGLTSAVSDGHVFKVSGGKITIMDSVGTGKITGGNNTGNGGAFCIENRATLTLNGGKIYGNNAKNGGGVYVCNALFFMNGGCVEKNTAEYGGGISLDKKSYGDTEYIVCKGGKITENNARLGGGVCLDSSREDVVVTFENTQISDNFATDVGGGVYIGFTYEASEVAFGKGTSITKNISDEGGGVYVNCGSIRLIGTHITENRAFTRCGGVGAEDDMDDNAHGNITEYGTYTLGGDLYIQNNYVQEDWTDNAEINSNLRIGDITCDLCYDVNNPFTDNASIGIDMYADFGTDEIEEKLSDEKGNFSIDSYEHFTADNPDYIITARDGGESAGANRYQIYSEQAKNALKGGITGAVLKSNFKSGTAPVIDKQNKTVTFTVNPKMGRTLENIALFTLADFSYGDDAVGIIDGTDVKDLSAADDYRWQVMKKNNSYELWYIKIIPYGGAWSEEDESAARVTVDGKTRYYADFETAWTKAVEASTQKSTIFVLNKDWHAGDADSNGRIDSNETKGAFKYYKNGSEYGTSKGSLYLDELTMNLTIDLNGHTIDRGLTDAVSNGYVLYMDIYGSITIKDSSEAQTGKITGGNNKDNGGAIYVDYGKLHVNGGSITGNKAEYGGAIYCDDLDDAFVYIEGGKIIGNTATENGGGIYVYNGYIYVGDGEISGNTAKKGAGVYWDSRNAGCFTGGVITDNNATNNGGGIYGTDWGKMYFGGTVVISGNKGIGSTNNNLYLSDSDVYVNRAAGQSDKIPDVPFADGASIGISMPETEDTVLISGSDSRFDSNNFCYFFGDNSGYFVRAEFDEKDSSHTHKLYYNKWGHKKAVYPKITSVSPRENNGLISEASINLDKQIITLKAISHDKSLFESVVVEKLVSFTTSNDTDVYWRFCDVAFDLSKPIEYKVVSKSTGTYVHCRVVVEFPDCTHNDKDGDYICDNCEEYIFTDFTITDYNKETKETTVFITTPGRYSLILADYENECLENMDIVEYDFKEGINVVPQDVTSFTLASGDKVMLWYDMVDLLPVCEALTLK